MVAAIDAVPSVAGLVPLTLADETRRAAVSSGRDGPEVPTTVAASPLTIGLATNRDEAWAEAIDVRHSPPFAS